jgi:NAD(P)-dependent dehydrogenase (short-subunit alcohol dehydrogenase family)
MLLATFPAVVFRVILVARRSRELESIADGIGELAVAEACDAASGEDVRELARRVRSQYGIPDVIVDCAGVGRWKFIEDTTGQCATHRQHHTDLELLYPYTLRLYGWSYRLAPLLVLWLKDNRC